MFNLYFVSALIIFQAEFIEGIHDVTCQNDSKVLECENNEVLFIKLAWYGRSDDRCGMGSSSDCIDPSIAQVLKNRCDCETQCLVEATDDVFGNACSGKGKYVYTLYECFSKEACINASSGSEVTTTASADETTKWLHNNQLNIQLTIVQTTSIRVIWNLMTPFSDDMVYTVYVRTIDQPCGSFVGGNANSPYTATDLHPGTAYKVRVCAYDVKNLQPLYTKVIDVLTKPPSLSQVTSVFDETGLQLHWKIIKGYADQIVIELTRSNIVQNIFLASFTTNYTVINLEEGDTYHIKLYSTITNVNGNQLKSDAVVLSSQNPTNTIGILLGSIFGGLVLVAIIAGVLIYWRKHKNVQETQTKKNKVSQPTAKNQSVKILEGDYITIDQREDCSYEEVKPQAPIESGYENALEKREDQHAYELYTICRGCPKCRPPA